MIGAALAEILALALVSHLPWWHALLVVPIALGLACVAGIAPAYAATRGRPLDAVYSVPAGVDVTVQSITFRHRGCEPATPARETDHRCAWVVHRRRGIRRAARSTAAFQGQVVGTALGNLVSVQVRSVDLIAAVLALLLGAFSVADVLAVNLRDRAGEQAVLAATGWRPVTLFRLAFTEGMVVGIVGALREEQWVSGLPRSLPDRRLRSSPRRLAAVIGLSSSAPC